MRIKEGKKKDCAADQRSWGYMARTSSLHDKWQFNHTHVRDFLFCCLIKKNGGIFMGFITILNNKYNEEPGRWIWPLQCSQHGPRSQICAFGLFCLVAITQLPSLYLNYTQLTWMCPGHLLTGSQDYYPPCVTSDERQLYRKSDELMCDWTKAVMCLIYN